MANRKLQYVISADVSQAIKNFDKFEKKVERIGREITKTGKSLSTLTAPFAAIGAIAIKSALDFEKAFNAIRSGTNATGEQLKGLMNDFRALNKTVPQSKEVVAKSLADVNTRLGLTGTNLQSTTKSFLDLSRIMGADVDTVIKTTTQAMNNWGVSANNAKQFLDKLYVASASMGIGVGELANNMSTVGATFRSLGFDVNQSIALIANFEKAGISASSMIMPLTKAMTNLSKAGVKDLSSGLMDIISRIKNAKTQTEAINIAIEAFGKRGANMATVIRDGRFEIDKLAQQLANSSGQLSAAAIDTMQFSESFALLKKKATDALEPLGKELLKIAVEYMPKVQKAIEWLGSESGLQAAKIGMITAACSAFVVILGSVIEKTAIAAKAIKGLIVLMAQNPYLAAIIAAGAGSYALTKAAVSAKQKQKGEKEMLAYVRSKEPNWGIGLNMSFAKSERGKKRETLKEAYDRLSGNKDRQTWTFDPNADTKGEIAIGNLSASTASFKTKGIKAKGGSKKTTDYTKKLADAKLDYENASGINNAIQQMQIYANALAKVDTATGNAEKQMAAWQEKLRLTNAFGSAMTERIREITESFNKGDIIFEEASEQIGEIATKFDLTKTQAEQVNEALKKIQETANANTEAFYAEAKATEDYLSKQKLITAENAYNAETAFGGTSSIETARTYLELLEQMRSQLVMGSAEWQAMGEKIREVNESTMGLNWKNITTEFNDINKQMQSMTSTFAIGFSDAIAGAIAGTKNLEESLVDMLKQMGQMVVKALLLNAIMGIFGVKKFSGIGDFIQQTFSGIKMHTGGIVGRDGEAISMPASTWNNAPRLHTGNLRADEYPAILQKGETVIPKNASLAKGTDEPVNVTVNISAVDSKSFMDYMSSNSGGLESLIINSLRRGGSLRGAIKGATV